MSKSILFYKPGKGITFEQRVGIKEDMVSQLAAAGLSDSVKPIILNDCANVSMFDGDLSNKLGALADKVEAQAEAITALTTILIEGLGIADEPELHDEDKDQTL